MIAGALGCHKKQSPQQGPIQIIPKYFQPGNPNRICINIDDFQDGGYSTVLHRMTEPVFPDKSGDSGFRFVWLRSFHPPVSIRIIKNKSKISLYAIELDHLDSFEPQEILRKLEMKLTEDQWAEIQKRFSKAGFWDVKSLPNRRGCDGSEWIFEGYKPSRYKAVGLWSPEKGDYWDLGLYLIEVTGWTFTKECVY